MNTRSTIQQSLISRLSVLRDNTIIIDDLSNLQLNTIEKGILIVYAMWSGKAIENCIRTIRLLYQNSYAGKIIMVDIDTLISDFQVSVLGQVCNGWGEIFTIHNGTIIEKYLGKKSFADFKTSLQC
ncbi:MAG: hypothetical protein QM802_06705 [Agriterribacter sp.]